MYFEIDEEYNEKPNFVFGTTNTCTALTTCFDVMKNFDSIKFDGALTVAPMEYVATLKDNSNFTFIFGKKVAPPEELSTSHSTTLETATEEPVTQPSTSELTPPSSESNGSQDSSDKNEQETNPTTSGGGMNVGSNALILLAIFKPFFTQ